MIEVGGEDIIQRYVKQRDDWWSDGLFSSPLAKTGAGGGDGPIKQVLAALPWAPSYFFLLTSSVVAIAFVGCIFHPASKQPASAATVVSSHRAHMARRVGPASSLFLAAIRKTSRKPTRTT